MNRGNKEVRQFIPASACVITPVGDSGKRMLTISMVFKTFDCSKARCILNGKLVFYANDSDKYTRL